MANGKKEKQMQRTNFSNFANFNSQPLLISILHLEDVK